MVAMGAAYQIQGKADIYDDLLRMAELALRFGQIDRTAVFHPDQITPESDTDHTVMLGWAAPALAARLYPHTLDVGLVAQFALVHDVPEVYAGDTPTLRITPDERAAKAGREHDAAERLCAEFSENLPWFTRTLVEYEAQDAAEARFVRAVDKLLPKLVHIIDRFHGLFDIDMTTTEFSAMLEEQRASLVTYASDFPELLDLHEDFSRIVRDGFERQVARAAAR